METLNEDDLDWLTRVENRLLSMQKREAANTKSWCLENPMKESIKSVHEMRQVLQARFGKTVDRSMD